MDFDTTTLRYAFAVVAAAMLMLFFLDSFRSTRSAYSWWWCAVLACVLLGSGASIPEGTSHQAWAVPAGNALLVAGATCAWAAARSLRRVATTWWQVAMAPTATGVAALAAGPADDVWAGGEIFLSSMCLMFGLSARELLRTGPGLRTLRIPAVVSAVLACAYYLVRCVTFVLDGPDGRVFSAYFSSQITMMATLAFLVVVSFSISALSSEQSHEALRIRATRDGLTGLLNRTEFIRLAADQIRHAHRLGPTAAVMLADLDDFKRINDTYGHQAGDRALEAFANACRSIVRSTDLVGRYGGEEFIFLLPATSLDGAEHMAQQINDALQESAIADEIPVPTVSYGLAEAGTATPLAASIASADAALYRAKALGRNMSVREHRDDTDGKRSQRTT